MNVALGLLGLALLGVDGDPKPEVPPIQYHVRVLDMDGLSWRESLYSRLKPVARRGSATVWTTGRDVVKPLTERAARVVMMPQLLAQPEAVAHFSQRTTRRVASQWTRHADGPPDHAVTVAYTPDFEDVREGCQFTLSGRSLDQGVLAKIVVDDTRITAIHQVKLTEAVVPEDKEASVAKMSPQLAVPEVVKTTLDGEWLLPKDEMLVVSLGANTVDDGQGKVAVRERLMLIEADPASLPARGRPLKAGVGGFTFKLPAVQADAEPMSPPAVPTRSLPQARAKDGSPVPLPPLPEEPIPPTALPGTSEPCATPQTRPLPEIKILDPDSKKAAFPAETKAKAEEPEAPKPAARSAWNPIIPFLFRLPLSAGVTIDFRASISPLSKP